MAATRIISGVRFVLTDSVYIGTVGKKRVWVWNYGDSTWHYGDFDARGEERNLGTRSSREDAMRDVVARFKALAAAA